MHVLSVSPILRTCKDFQVMKERSSHPLLSRMLFSSSAAAIDVSPHRRQPSMSATSSDKLPNDDVRNRDLPFNHPLATLASRSTGSLLEAVSGSVQRAGMRMLHGSHLVDTLARSKSMHPFFESSGSDIRESDVNSNRRESQSSTGSDLASVLEETAARMSNSVSTQDLNRGLNAPSGPSRVSKFLRFDDTSVNHPSRPLSLGLTPRFSFMLSISEDAALQHSSNLHSRECPVISDFGKTESHASSRFSRNTDVLSPAQNLESDRFASVASLLLRRPLRKMARSSIRIQDGPSMSTNNMISIDRERESTLFRHPNISQLDHVLKSMFKGYLVIANFFYLRNNR